MKTLINPPVNTWPILCKRPRFAKADLDVTVREIISRVRSEGNKALYYFSEKFDGSSVRDLRISQAEIAGAGEKISESLKSAIRSASANLRKFHEAQLIDEPEIETSKGVKCWRKSVPIEKVGLYIPGGTAPLFSTLLMLGIPAKIAGCRSIIVCSPPDSMNRISPLILYAASVTGITDIFRAGGAQAIAAMAYGTSEIPAVDKIFGPGNQYVTRAKELVQLDGIPIDMPAGPSEVLVIADESADPAFVAADLLSQAEHGTDSHVVLVTDHPGLIENVKTQIDEQIRNLPRRDIALKSLEGSVLILLGSSQECLDFSNLYAPEHLIISTSDPCTLAGKVINAGSVFLGKYSCESAGDYASGTNHTLPTNGFAKNFSGVSVESFMKKVTFQQVSPEGLKLIGPVIEVMAEAEHLEGHRNAVSIRLKTLINE